MNDDWWRTWMLLAACWFTAERDACATPRWCVACQRAWLEVEAVALALDLVTGSPQG